MFKVRDQETYPVTVRCFYDICNRHIRDIGYACEGSIYCSEECCVRDLTEREPVLPRLQ